MNISSSIRMLVCAGLACTALGCEKNEISEGSIGELGRVQFTYSRSCFFGCLLNQPLLAGTRETIKVTDSGNDPRVTVKSDDEDVAEVAVERQCYCAREDTTGRLDVEIDGMCAEPWFKTCENLIQVGTNEPGDAKVELYNASNALIDRITVHVERADHARFFGTLPDALGEEESDAFNLPADGQLELRVELYDEDGLELLAPTGVLWRSADPAIATLNAFLIGAGPEVEAGRDIVVKALAEGETTIELQVPGITTQVTVEVSTD